MNMENKTHYSGTYQDWSARPMNAKEQLTRHVGKKLGVETLLRENGSNFSSLEKNNGPYTDDAEWRAIGNAEGDFKVHRGDTPEQALADMWIHGRDIQILGEVEIPIGREVKVYRQYLSGEHPSIGEIHDGWSGRETVVDIYERKNDIRGTSEL